MKFVRRFAPYLVLVVLLVTGGTLFVRHNEVLDWFWLRNYDPPASIRALSLDTGMTPYAERLFYVNKPSLEERDAFNDHCRDVSDQVAVLGCYTGDRQGIYLYNVPEPRLAGIIQVTAAHEMLHQAYDRLPGSERKNIERQLQEYYDKSAHQALKSQVDSYKKSEPDQLLNEMHSIFGTQASKLPAELETYYARYFKDRQKLITYYQAYQSEFDKRKALVAEYDRRLGELKPQIEAGKKDLDTRESDLKTERDKLNQYLDMQQIATYNAAVPGYNAQVNAYRNKLKEVNDMVDTYNRILGERNAIAVQERELQQAIDSHLSPANKQ
jgi:hypothetical protein